MKKLIFYLLIFFAFAKLDAQWVQVWNGMGQNYTIWSLANNGTKLFAGCRYDGLYTSTNEGLVWSVTSINSESIKNMLINGTDVYACSAGNKIYKSIDNGTSWPVFASFSYDVNCFLINENTYFAGLSTVGIYYSTNSGLNWVHSFLNNKTVYAFLYRDNYLFAGTSGSGVYYSTDNGYIWSQSSLNNRTINTLCKSDQYIFAGTEGYGVYRSSNNGLNWTQIGLNTLVINTIVKNGNYLYAGTGNSGIYISGDNGLSWSTKNDGLPNNTEVFSIDFTNNYIVIGTYANSAFRREKSQVGLTNISEIIPSSYVLNQNYPNPFNPTTTIKFDVPKSDNVKVNIFDMLGKEIAVIVNKGLSPGSYSVDWNASNFPSGVYFYSMQSGNFTQTKQMILLK